MKLVISFESNGHSKKHIKIKKKKIRSDYFIRRLFTLASGISD